jgi:hypothetical protein
MTACLQKEQLSSFCKESCIEIGLKIKKKAKILRYSLSVPALCTTL